MISDCLFCVICIFATTRTNCWNITRQPQILELIIIYNSFIRRLFSLKFHSCFVIHFMKLLEYIHGFTFVNTAQSLHFNYLIITKYCLLFVKLFYFLVVIVLCLMLIRKARDKVQKSMQPKASLQHSTNVGLVSTKNNHLKIGVCVIDC